jgi:predicted DNA-binding transcriptional regulator YafY
MPGRFFEKFKRIDWLISKKAFGSPAEFSEKLEISESTLFEYLAVMKEFGAPIVYNKNRQTYFYVVEGSCKICFEKKETPSRLE